MRLAEVIQLGLDSVLWRVTGWHAPGRRLIRALASEDAAVRTMAGMYLVRAGGRAEPLLREALDRRDSLPIILTIVGDIGATAMEPALVRFSRDQDSAVAQAASQALRVLRACRSPTPP